MPNLDALLTEARLDEIEADLNKRVPARDFDDRSICRELVNESRNLLAALRSVRLPATEEWEYGIKWGDDGVYQFCGDRERAEAKCSAKFRDEIVRRTKSRAIPAGPWEPLPSPGTTTEEE